MHQNDVISTHFAQFDHILTHLTPLKNFKPHKSVYILVHISKGNNLKVKLSHSFALFGNYDPFLHQNDVILTRFALFERHFDAKEATTPKKRKTVNRSYKLII